MAKDKNSFILYTDQRGIFDKLSDEQAGKLIKHIYAYCCDENPESDFVTELAFESIKSALKRDLKKYEARADRSRENGKKGGRPKKPKKPSGLIENPEEPKKPDSVSDSVSDSDILLKKETKDIVENIYMLYPSKCIVKKSSTGKSRKKNIEQIKRLLKTNSPEKLKETIERYVNECRKDQVYMKNFTTFLNNLPDYETPDAEIKPKKVYQPFKSLYD